MIDQSSRHPVMRAIGVSWFRKEDYDAIRKISEDGHRMPDRWEDWLKNAEEKERKVIKSWQIVERVYIDPDTFPDWCRANDVGVSREGRHKFVVTTLAAKYGNKS
jgi:hypothetical protein